MPWHIAKSDACPASKPWAVIKDSDGDVEGCHASKADAQKQLGALNANESDASRTTTVMRRLEELRDFVRSVDPDLQRVFDFEVEEVRDSGSGAGIYTIKGHAAVFGKWSLDLGGFRERIKKGAFDNVLSRDPHVLHVWDHDTSKALSSTRSSTYPLELRTDPAGLRYYSKVAPTSYSQDLRILLEAGVISQSSFAFTVADGGDEWRIAKDGEMEVVERTITEVQNLYDVTTCAMGAYPTTDSALAVRSMSFGRRNGAGSALADIASAAPDEADVGTADAPDEPVVTPQTDNEAVEPPGTATTPETPVESEDWEAKEREFAKWQLERAAEYRRTRNYAFGVHDNDGDKK